ncbi:hypothetical protein WN944_008459 [Citrus x changshan-huyou]|uniref:Uncharacterized protein n=1 Tax=Citrus x changshan-huyou TaxID=2935761 RepID=A0AAP0QV99_9ROSI
MARTLYNTSGRCNRILCAFCTRNSSSIEAFEQLKTLSETSGLLPSFVSGSYSQTQRVGVIKLFPETLSSCPRGQYSNFPRARSQSVTGYYR